MMYFKQDEFIIVVMRDDNWVYRWGFEKFKAAFNLPDATVIVSRESIALVQDDKLHVNLSPEAVHGFRMVVDRLRQQ